MLKYVNCGCGNKFSTEKEWTNIDFASADPLVRAHNILKGLPFQDDEIDAIFSSCMLEHFSKDDALRHLKECYRVLKPGGIIRIVVPDLEDVCREYLRVLDCVRNDESVQKKYEYVLIELLDQLSRRYSGGEMGKYWKSDDRDEEYILERTGYPEVDSGRRTIFSRAKNFFVLVCDKMFGWIPFYKKYMLGRFMMSGEVHCWMYDEFNLKKLMENAGFSLVTRKSANESNILEWEKFQIEMKDGKEYKPHSLYMEAVKK